MVVSRRHHAAFLAASGPVQRWMSTSRLPQVERGIHCQWSSEDLLEQKLGGLCSLCLHSLKYWSHVFLLISNMVSFEVSMLEGCFGEILVGTFSKFLWPLLLLRNVAACQDRAFWGLRRQPNNETYLGVSTDWIYLASERTGVKEPHQAPQSLNFDRFNSCMNRL